jgi:hypothetical protein
MKITLTKFKGNLVPHGEDDREKLDSFADGASYICDIKNMDIRTLKQNSSLHLWCDKIAKLLNSNNLYMKGVFGNDIEWSMDLVKTQIVKATIKKVFDLDSTTKLSRKQIDSLIDYVTIAFASKGIEIPEFPNKELWDKIKMD